MKYILTIKGLLLLCILLLAGPGAKAQRMSPGIKGIEADAGLYQSEDPLSHHYAALAIVVYRQRGNYRMYCFEYSYREHLYRGVPVVGRTFLAEAGHSFYLYGNAGKTIAFNGTFTGVGGYESIHEGETKLFDGAKLLEDSGIVYGAGARLSFEIYLSDRVVVVLSAKARLLWGTSLEQLRPSSGIGIRYNLN